MFTIGQLAKEVGVNIQTIRYYERLGFFAPIDRNDSGYRSYDSHSVKKLRFIIQAKDLGFQLKEIEDLLELRFLNAEKCEKVRVRAESKLSEIKKKITQLKSIEENLSELILDCKKAKSDGCCPIIEKLEH